jgi:(p)ppGpp synthase/HD superfamily hydrolase
MLGKAIALAAQSFEHIKDKGGQPYILHCLRLMNNLHTDDEELKIIAILHDWVEDMFKDNPEKGLLLLREQYSERVIRALDLLTHRKGVPYDDYIKELSFNSDARLVKLADLKDNSDITRLKGLTKKDFDRMEKYHRSYIYLSKI